VQFQDTAEELSSGAPTTPDIGAAGVTAEQRTFGVLTTLRDTGAPGITVEQYMQDIGAVPTTAGSPLLAVPITVDFGVAADIIGRRPLCGVRISQGSAAQPVSTAEEAPLLG
jgi:hypothetical protein